MDDGRTLLSADGRGERHRARRDLGDGGASRAGSSSHGLLAVEVVLPEPAAVEAALVVDLVVVVAPAPVVELPQAAQVTATTSAMIPTPGAP